MNWNELMDQAEALRAEGKPVVATNGCFDLLHIGHVSFLEECSRLGTLFVGVNSNRSVAAIKGPTRPVIDEFHRTLLVASLRCVSGATMFFHEDARAFLDAVKPTIWCKSTPWTRETVNPLELDAVERNGGRLEIIPPLFNISTTDIIERVLALHAGVPRVSPLI